MEKRKDKKIGIKIGISKVEGLNNQKKKREERERMVSQKVSKEKTVWQKNKRKTN